MANKSSGTKEFGSRIFYCGMLLVSGMLAYQSWLWLRLGKWVLFPISTLWNAASASRPHASLLGVQAILDWALDFPISGVGFLVAMFGLCVALYGTGRTF